MTCSVSHDVFCGLSEHPTNWLSTHPFQYGDDRRFDFYDKRRNPVRTTTWGTQSSTIIGNDVWIGAGVIISQGVTIGDGVIIGAQSLVTKDVAPYSIVGGGVRLSILDIDLIVIP